MNQVDCSNTIKGVVETVAEYQKASKGATDVSLEIANKIGGVAQNALSKTPTTVQGCTAFGATLGGLIGGPAAPITAFMGAGTGAVVGCIISAIKGDFD